MADNIVPIASAVILPQHPENIATAPTKRQQSPTSDSESKRVRLEKEGPSELKKKYTETVSQGNAIESFNNEKNDKIEERRKSNAVEEKKRGQRLFGGLLSALSQSTQNRPQKKRLETQKPQLERANVQKKQDEIPKCGRVTKLLDVQKQEQIKFEKESMRIRHENIHAMANFLCTKTEPKIYYRPWELLPEQKECIDSQIASISEITQREVSEFNQKFEIIPKVDDEKKSPRVPEETSGEPCVKPQDITSSTESHDTNANNLQTTGKIETTEETERDKEEQNGEVMVENDEDIVIY